MPIKVAVVEDDKIIREGIVMLIQSHDELECVGSYENAEIFMHEIKSILPQVVLMDIELPGHSGIATLLHLKPKYPDIQFMMFTVFDNPEKIFDSLAAGATGYILKNEPPAKLLEAIREIYKGNSPMSAPIARLVVNYFNHKNKETKTLETLTIREREVLQLLSKGFLYKEIADKMFISIETVRSYIRKIYEKLHVHTRTDAINTLRNANQ